MDHLCYLNLKDGEYQKLLHKGKTKLARGTRSKKPPYKHVFSGDRIFFVDEKFDIVFSAEVAGVLNEKKADKAKVKQLILSHKDDFDISQHEMKKLMRKNYIVLISLCDIKQVKDCSYKNIRTIRRRKWILAGSVQKDK